MRVRRGFALNQPLGLGDDEGFETVYQAVEQYQQPTIMDSIVGSGRSVLDTVTQPDVVKAALNKYIFGRPSTIPVSPTAPRAASKDNTLLYGVGIVAAIFLLPNLLKGRRR